jgi:hypothetical protein
MYKSSRTLQQFHDSKPNPISHSPPTSFPDGPPPLPSGGLAGAGRERSGDQFPFAGLVFFLLGLVSSDIKVVVKMSLWNKVSPASSYLDDVLSGPPTKG